MKTEKFVPIRVKLLPWILILFVLSVFMGGSVYYNISIQKNDGLLINLAGRQRMLSQKMTKELLSFKLDTNPALAQKKEAALKNTIALFDKTLNGFLHGGNVPTTLNANGKTVTIETISDPKI